jgi:hypothetical protein
MSIKRVSVQEGRNSESPIKVPDETAESVKE